MSIKLVFAGLGLGALIATPAAVLAQAMPSAPIPYSQLNEQTESSAKPMKHHAHHASKKMADDPAKMASDASDQAKHESDKAADEAKTAQQGADDQAKANGKAARHYAKKAHHEAKMAKDEAKKAEDAAPASSAPAGQ